MSCQALNRPWIVASHAGNRQAIVYRPGCGLWTCPDCAIDNASKWIARAAHGCDVLMQQGYNMSFVTVTSRGGHLSSSRSIIIFGDAWPKLSRKARATAGGKWEYFLVPERQKNGKIHAHILSSYRHKKRFWKDTAYWSGLGYIADEKPLTAIPGVVGYVTKYITKTIEGERWPDKFRRVRCSNGWPKLPKKELKGWEYEVFMREADMFWETYYLKDAGYNVTITDAILAKGYMSLSGLGANGPIPQF